MPAGRPNAAMFREINFVVVRPKAPLGTVACMTVIRLIFVMFAFTVVAPAALAQQTESRITGKVADQSQGALPGVTVIVTNKATAAARTDITDAEGNYAVTNLGPGAYEVRIELQGFAPKTRDVVLGVGQSEKVEVELGVASLHEQVTVSAAAPVLDLTSAKIGVNVSPDEVENLPVNGRNFANLMTLATGTFGYMLGPLNRTVGLGTARQAQLSLRYSF